MHILQVAAENGALKGAKTGGLADVVGGVCPELVRQGCSITTVLPSYGFLHLTNPSAYGFTVHFIFRGFPHQVDFYEVTVLNSDTLVRHLVALHPVLAETGSQSGGDRIYAHDPPDRPFATDASRFALFCTAVATAIVENRIPLPGVIHLHDWHTSFLLILRKYHPDFASLKSIRMVYTIHNLALQGIRPLHGSDSSLAAWFPGLSYNPSDLADPRWPDCVNPMAAGIRLGDAVHTVSPAYAKEILQTECKPHVCSGGEGLEKDLQEAEKENRLIGILNGCAYPENRMQKKTGFPVLARVLKSAIPGWLEGNDRLPIAHFLAYIRLSDLESGSKSPSVLLTSVTRLTDQKVLLMKASGSKGKSGLEEILDFLKQEKGLYVMLGTGETVYERFFADMSARFEGFIFLNGFSNSCADHLYANGDLFLMPSSFEPCGISQMLAMRDGQPCVVHHVGGLKDTVRHQENGFSFSGATQTDQVDHFISTVQQAVLMRRNKQEAWNRICSQAAAERFSWEKSAGLYIEKLYNAVSAPISHSSHLSSALLAREDIRNRLANRKPAVFLDYDGTLTPIAERPERAVLSTSMRETLKSLASLCTVGILSGRGLEDVKKLVNLENILYSGSHGFEIAPYRQMHFSLDEGENFLPVLDQTEKKIKKALKDIQGAFVERKKYSIAVHFRQVDPVDMNRVEKQVNEIVAKQNQLHASRGKKVFDIKPAIDWHKGKALLWILEKLERNRPEVLPIYIGDDTADEDAFREVSRMGGIGIIVRDSLSRPTHARLALDNTEEVRLFLEFLIDSCLKNAGF